MLLFLTSFLMVILSSYFLASIFAKKRYLLWLIYTLLIAFSQVVFTIEVLSLFKAITKNGILFVNILFLILSIYLFYKKGRKLFRPKFRDFFNQIVSALRKDKILCVLVIGFVFFIFVTIFLCIFCPIINYDGLSYHINRALVWASQGNLSHFDIADDRNINMAINTELLYTWFFTFVSRNICLGFFAFAGYVLSVISLYSFLEINGFCIRKRLWVLFLFTSLAGVVVESSGIETDIIIGGLVLASMALFLFGAKFNKIESIYFSSLAVILAVGAKTSAFFVLPAISLIFLCILLKYQREKFVKFIGLFVLFSLVNFIVFSAYNYVLNFIEFGNFIGSSGTREWHRIDGGMKGFLSGLIRHFVLLFDFTGFKYGFYVEKTLFSLQNKLLDLFNIPLNLNVIMTNYDFVNVSINDSKIGGGVVGTLVLLPCVLIAILKGLFYNKNFKNRLLGVLAIGLPVSVAVMSASIGFMLYSSRFIVTFLIMVSPVLVFSYIKSNKNVFKYIILFWVMSYLTIISTHIWSRHFVSLGKEFIKGKSIREIRTNHLCSLTYDFDGKIPFCRLRSYLYTLPKNSNIGFFSSVGENVAIIKFMENDGYNVDFMLVEKMNKYDLRKYDFLLFTSAEITSSYIREPKETLSNYYVKNGQLKFVDGEKPICYLLNTIKKDVLVTEESYKKVPATHIKCMLPYQILKDNDFYLYANFSYNDINYDNLLEDNLVTMFLFKNKKSY